MHKCRKQKVWGPYPYRAGIDFPGNPAAHGNIAEVHVCTCGNRKWVNINFNHVEHGPWTVQDHSPLFTVSERTE